MAANIFDGSTDSNWGTAANWSQNTVPTATDGHITTFDATSPACTVNTSNRVADNIDFTNYTNTITMTYGITVSGDITLGASMIIAGTGYLKANAAGSWNFNGKTWPNAFSTTLSAVYTLLSHINITGDATFGTTTGTTTLNGAFNINVGGSLIHSGTTAVITGTATIVLAGTGNWSMPTVTTGNWNIALVINTTGTYTLTTNILFGNSAASLTYTAGTLVSTGYKFYCGTLTLNLNGLTIAGLHLSMSSTAVLTLASGLVISESLTNSEVLAHMSIVSSVADTQRTLTLLAGATQDLCKVDATDIDSSAGQTIYTHRGVLDNSLNWVSFTKARDTVASVF